MNLLPRISIQLLSWGFVSFKILIINLNINSVSFYNYKRRPSSVTTVGRVKLGGDNPIRVQSMNNTSTLDTEGSVAQALRIAEAGGELVRLTTQGVREAENMANICL